MLQANKIHSLDFKQKFLYSVVVDQLNKSKRETMKDLCIEGEIVKHLSVPDWNVIPNCSNNNYNATWQKIESTTWKIVWVVAIPLLQKYFELK